jgi:nucleoside-diphosphate-sugar epimerase
MNNVMKYVITGHRSGIGKSIFDYYAKQPDTYCIGYDKSHHLDLNDPKVHSDFIENCKDASVIVLNAHTGQQHTSLETLYNLYKQQSKHIIVMGSMVSKLWKTPLEVPKGFEDYWMKKYLLDQLIEKLYNLNLPLKISIIRPAWVDTQLATEYSGKKLTIESVLNSVRFIIENKDAHITNMELQCTN